MSRSELGSICFVGGGAMGCYNAILAALAGYSSVIYDASENARSQIDARLQETARQLSAAGLCASASVQSALGLIRVEPDLAQAIQGAWLVSESVFEDLELKRRVFAQLEAACDDTVLLTTNSSALLGSDIESVLKVGDRFAALHSHLGAKLFDIVGGPRTSSQTIARLQAYVVDIGGFPLVQKRENKGYVFNAMIGPVLATALYLAATGADSVRDIDRSWMLRTGSPMGPFGMIDLFGLGLIYSAWRNRPDDLITRFMRDDILAFMAPVLGTGREGVRTGGGFYNYPHPAYARQDFLEKLSPTSAAGDALVSAWTQNAVLLACNNVASPENVDRAWMVATGQSRGPFGELDRIGLDRASLLFRVSGAMVPHSDHPRLMEYLQQRTASHGAGEKSGAGFYTYPAPAYAQEQFLTASVLASAA